MSGRALWLPDVFRAAGLPVVVEAGFETRGRAGLEPAWIVEHHTASSARAGNTPALGICRDGRGEPNPVAGPLCNWFTARDGTIHVVASGVANHAGKGQYPDGTTGNHRSFGNEAENDGIGEPWPTVQLHNIAAADAAVCRHLGWTADRVIGHREFTTRKIDPTYDLDAHRARVAQLISPAPVAADQEEEDMPAPRYVEVHPSDDRKRGRRLFRVTENTFAVPLSGAEWGRLKDLHALANEPFPRELYSDAQWQTLAVGYVDPTTGRKVTV